MCVDVARVHANASPPRGNAAASKTRRSGEGETHGDGGKPLVLHAASAGDFSCDSAVPHINDALVAAAI